jgi:hypothetical protein
LATVVFSSGQRRLVGGDERVDIEASRVVELIEALYLRYPELEGKLDGAAVAIDGVIHNDARYLPLRPESEVHFMGAIAGGSGVGPVRAASSSKVSASGDPLRLARDWRRAGRGVALATVLETWGSSPCPAGSLLVVDETGAFEGSVSGGCVEGAVIEKALEVIQHGNPDTLEFGIADEQAWAVGLACGGRVRIRVEPVE